MREYTEQQIKETFWKTFHESGELWFDYLSKPKENEESTESYWEDFKDNLPPQQ